MFQGKMRLNVYQGRDQYYNVSNEKSFASTKSTSIQKLDTIKKSVAEGKSISLQELGFNKNAVAVGNSRFLEVLDPNKYASAAKGKSKTTE